MDDKISLRYKDSGVDIDSSNNLINRIKNIVKKSYRSEVASNKFGNFSSFCAIPQKYHEPILVSTTDGVGTKLRLAIDLKCHNSIGIDLVAMCVNDLIVYGAEPLFFLDYYATGKLNIDIAYSVINGIVEGCRRSGCALIGGETAEMPSIYNELDYDLAGFCVGVVEKSKIINGNEKIQDGDVLIALGSNGLHSNGYSLIRKILKIYNIDPLIEHLDGKLLADYLLKPTHIYVNDILNLIKDVDIHAIAHITGGGILENIPRFLPKKTQAIINHWQWPTIFNWIQIIGNISNKEMYRTFNCGVGMVIAVSNLDADKTINLIHTNGLKTWKIGVIKKTCSSNNKDPIIINI